MILRRALLVAIFAAVGVSFAGGQIARLGYAAIACFAAIAAAWWWIDRRFDAQRWWDRAVNPIVLESPVTESWYVAAGGPERRHNPRFGSLDQVFAYEFLPKNGDGEDRAILAPCDGTVAWTNDSGNAYVSIETPRGFVVLAQLTPGTIAVRIADAVHAGMTIARSRRLQVHAQDRPQLSAEIARAIPIAFLDERGVAQVLEYGDELQPAPSGSPVQDER